MARKQKKVKSKSKYYYLFRSSVTGRFVTEKYAKRYPAITVRQRLLRFK